MMLYGGYIEAETSIMFRYFNNLQERSSTIATDPYLW